MIDAKAHALRETPGESCGLVISGKYFACSNVAKDPTADFIICPNDYLSAAMSGKIEAVVHSHPKGGPPSEFDRNACRATRLPWFVFDVPNDEWLTIDP